MHEGPPVAPHASPPPARQRAVWPIVAATLGAVLAAGLIFGAGILVGVWAGRQAPAGQVGAVPAPTAPPSGSPEDDAGAPAQPDGGLDECVVGTWTTVEHSEQFDLEDKGGVVTISGVERELTFTADGTETVTYSGAEATVETEDGTGVITFDGVVEYQVQTSGGTMSFTVAAADGTVTVTDAQGQEQTQPLQPGTGDIRYTCDGSTLTQSGGGYEATFTRAG